MKKFPHEEVYIRLGVSKIQGIGVFAIKKIPRGTNIYKNDQMEVYWFDKYEIESTRPPEQLMKLYKDFCILKDGKYGCPFNFNSITPGWYMNEPIIGNTANVEADENYDFFSIRDIEEGEELTATYSVFSEKINRY